MATTTQHQQEKNSANPQLLLALDLGLKTWKLGFTRDFRDPPWVREMEVSELRVLITNNEYTSTFLHAASFSGGQHHRLQRCEPFHKQVALVCQ